VHPRDGLAELGDWLGAFYMGLVKQGMYPELAYDLTNEMLHVWASIVMEVEE
jgi:hypothetical protein